MFTLFSSLSVKFFLQVSQNGKKVAQKSCHLSKSSSFWSLFPLRSFLNLRRAFSLADNLAFTFETSFVSSPASSLDSSTTSWSTSLSSSLTGILIRGLLLTSEEEEVETEEETPMICPSSSSSASSTSSFSEVSGLLGRILLRRNGDLPSDPSLPCEERLT